MLFRRSASLDTKPLFVFVAFYYFAYLLSNALSGDFPDAMTSLSNEWLPLTVVFWGMLDWDERRTLRAMDIWLAAAAIFAGYAVYQHFVGWDVLRGKAMEQIGRFYIATATFSEHLTFAGVYFIIAFFVLGFLLSGGGGTKMRRTLYWMFFVLCTVAVIFSYARSVWLAMVFSSLVAAGMRGKRALLWAIAIIIIASLAAIALFPSVAMRTQTMFSASFGSNANRLTLWRTAVNMIKHSPILGFGAGGFSRNFEKFSAGGFCPIKCHPHSDYLNILVEAGALGFVAYIGLFAAFFAMSLRARKLGQGFWSQVATGTIVAISGMMLAGMFECFFVNDEVEELIIATLCLGVISYKRVKDEQKMRTKIACD